MTGSRVPDLVAWRAATTTHDWSDGKYLAKLFALWRKAGLIGPPDTAAGGDDKPLRLAPRGDVAKTLLSAPARRGQIAASVAGSDPHPWHASLVLYPFDRELGRNEGYNMVALEVPRPVCAALPPGKLLDLFDRAHGPDDTEFAGIHPKAHWAHLQAEVYVPALTIGPMFAGLYWADFLGPGTVELFSRRAIDGLDLARCRWHGRRGVSFAVTDDLASADTPETEDRLAAMTDHLRQTMSAP